jgi:hypothetical protein
LGHLQQCSSPQRDLRAIRTDSQLLYLVGGLLFTFWSRTSTTLIAIWENMPSSCAFELTMESTFIACPEKVSLHTSRSWIFAKPGLLVDPVVLCRADLASHRRRELEIWTSRGIRIVLKIEELKSNTVLFNYAHCRPQARDCARGRCGDYSTYYTMLARILRSTHTGESLRKNTGIFWC